MMKDILSELSKVNRPGMNELIKFLVSSDYFSAPASRGYHLNVVGGLAKHHWNVFKELCDIKHSICQSADNDSIRICALLHDICKVNFFKVERGGDPLLFGSIKITIDD